jgi:proteic killer suppression protein
LGKCRPTWRPSQDDDPGRICEEAQQRQSLDDLRVPPGNRLEALRGDRRGQFSLRINDQWRICFAWRGTDACEVEIVDYH